MDATIFFPLAVVIALTPGPNNFCSLNHGLRHGVVPAVVGTTGRAVAYAVFLTVSALGLGAMLLASETAFTVLKWVGAAYLFYLGLKTWRSRAFELPAADGASSEHADSRAGLWRRLITKEFLVGISNPKAIVLFAAVFPQFIDPTQPAAMQFVRLGALYLVAEFVASLVYALGGLQVRRFVNTPQGARRVNQATGSVFMGAGALLMTAHR